MYCGACARDIALVRGLRARGHDVSVVPLYTPVRIDGDEPFPIAPVFLGGINLYLQQRSAFFRRLPKTIDRILDSSSLLRFVSKFAINTKASELGDMTVSVLAGGNGPLRKESDYLLDYLEKQDKPEIIVITNTMLSGLAPEFKKRLDVPIICQVQGEDAFVGGMPDPHRIQAEELIRENARFVDLFVSPNEAYAETMRGYLGVPEDKLRVVRTGFDAQAFDPEPTGADQPFTIGYLSVITGVKGLDILVDAWRKLVEDEGRDARLLVAGRVLDKAYFAGIERSVRDAGLADRFEFLGELEFDAKVDFLNRCSAFSVPSRTPEVRGLAVMEAMASGLPTVAPNSGVYPEVLGLTRGGMLSEPESADDLAAKLAQLMDDAGEANRLGQAGAQGVAEHYNIDQAADA